MKRKRIIAILIFTLFLALFGLAGTEYESTADLVILGLYLGAFLSLIIHKTHLWIKYRNRLSNRAALLASTQLLLPPKLISCFIIDEDRSASKREQQR